MKSNTQCLLIITRLSNFLRIRRFLPPNFKNRIPESINTTTSSAISNKWQNLNYSLLLWTQTCTSVLTKSKLKSLILVMKKKDLMIAMSKQLLIRTVWQYSVVIQKILVSLSSTYSIVVLQLITSYCRTLVQPIHYSNNILITKLIKMLRKNSNLPFIRTRLTNTILNRCLQLEALFRQRINSLAYSPIKTQQQKMGLKNWM